MSDDTQLTIDGPALDDDLTIETSGRVIRPFNRMVRKVVDEYKLYASDEGLHVRAVDPPNVMYVDATIPKSQLEGLTFDGDEMCIGVSASHFGGALSDARYGKSTDDRVRLSANGATLEAVIDRDFEGVTGKVTNRAELIDPAALRTEPPMLEEDRASFTIPPDAFIDVVSSFGSFDEAQGVSVTIADGVATFSAAGDTRSRQIELNVDADGEAAETVFLTSYLSTIAEGMNTGYAEEAKVLLTDDFPLTVRFVTEQDIHVEYTVAPRVSRDAP